MLKYQVRTLEREKKRQSTISANSTSVGLKDLFLSPNDSGMKHRDILENDCKDDMNERPFESSMSSSYSIKSVFDQQNKFRSRAFGSDSDSTGSGNDQRSIPAYRSRKTKFDYGSKLQKSRPLKIWGRSTSVSSLSSASTSSDLALEWGTVRVYTQAIRPDTTYCTIMANSCTTASDLVKAAINRVRIKSKINSQTQNMFYLTMELSTRQNQAHSEESQNEVKNVLVLDPDSKPLELQACHPNGKSKFVIQARYSFPVKIYDYCISNTSNYKSLLVSQCTTCLDVITTLLQMHKIYVYDEDDLENFSLVFVDYRRGVERILDPHALVFEVCAQIEGEHHQIHIKQFLPVRYDSRSPCSQSYYRNSTLKLDQMYDRLIHNFNEFVL